MRFTPCLFSEWNEILGGFLRQNLTLVDPMALPEANQKFKLELSAMGPNEEAEVHDQVVQVGAVRFSDSPRGEERKKAADNKSSLVHPATFER